jgi:hypothetical protein
MKALSLIVVVLLISASAPVLAETPAPAGVIKVASGAAVIVRNGAEIPATVGAAVFETDTLKTAAGGQIGVTLKDSTRVSVGPGSEVRLDAFQYAPAEGRLALVLKFVRGVTAYVSGRIAKLAPDAVRLETPAAIVGVRGTSLIIQVVGD